MSANPALEPRLMDRPGEPPVGAASEFGAGRGLERAAKLHDFDLAHFLRLIRRRKALIFITALLPTLAAAVVVQHVTPVYTAETTLMIETRRSKVVEIEAVLSGLAADLSAIRSELEVLRSVRLAGQVVDRYELTKDPEFNPDLRPRPAVTVWNTLRLSKFVPKKWQDMLLGPDTATNPVGDSKDHARTLAITEYLKRLSVTNDGRSYVIRVEVQSSSAAKAARLANTHVAIYLAEQRAVKSDATQRATAWLNTRVDEMRAKVRDAERAVQQFRERNNLFETRDGTVTAQQLSELNTKLIIARAERSQGEARLRQVQELMRKSGGIETAGEVLSSPVIQKLREQEADVQRREAELRTRYGEKHPRIINVKAERNDLKRKIDQEVRKIAQNAANEVEILRAREQALHQNLEELQQRNADLVRAEIQLRELEREAEAGRLVFETFLTRFKETSSQEDLQQADARVISLAEAAQRPTFPRKGQILILTLATSLLLGVGLAVLLEQMDRGLRGLEQVEAATGHPAIGMIPTPDGAPADPFRHALVHATSVFSESLRSLRTAIRFSNIDHPPRVILITSSMPEEGKTSTALSLAASAVKAGQRVLLIEADMRRPRIAKQLRLRPKASLGDLLSDNGSIEDAITIDPKSGLHVVIAAEGTPTPAELLGSRRMANFVRAAATQYDLVILDTPPVLPVSDPLVLARHADAVVFLVRWGSTPRDVVVNCLRRVSGIKANIAGVVLTRVNLRRHARYGYGDYGYYYGRYGRQYGA